MDRHADDIREIVDYMRPLDVNIKCIAHGDRCKDSKGVSHAEGAASKGQENNIDLNECGYVLKLHELNDVCLTVAEGFIEAYHM